MSEVVSAATPDVPVSLQLEQRLRARLVSANLSSSDRASETEEAVWFFGRQSSDNPGGSGQLSERELRLGYFGHVFADYCRLPRESREKLTGTGTADAPGDLPVSLGKLLRAVEQTGSIPKDQEELVDWSEIAILEDKILALQDRETLRRRVWALRSRYARLVGPDRYQQYLASRPPDETDPDVTDDTLRADLRGILGLTHLTYSLAVVRENLRRRVLMGVLGLAGVLCGGALVAAVVADLIRPRPGDPGWEVALLHRLPVAMAVLVAVLFGCLGAFLSTQRRLQQPSEGGDPLIAILGLYEFNNIKRFPLIAGGLFATVLYFILVAGFLKGDLFPDLQAGIPQGSVHWAKLVIWAFLSGFAERLVPDTLDRLVNEVQPRVPVSPPSSGPTDTGRPTERAKTEEGKSAEEAEEDTPKKPEADVAKESKTDMPPQGEPDDVSRDASGQPNPEQDQVTKQEGQGDGTPPSDEAEKTRESQGTSRGEGEPQGERKQETPQ